MGIRTVNPTTPGNRFATRSDFAEITANQPEKKLTKALRKSGGRNNKGRITVRHRGGGHRQLNEDKPLYSLFASSCQA